MQFLTPQHPHIICEDERDLLLERMCDDDLWDAGNIDGKIGQRQVGWRDFCHDFLAAKKCAHTLAPKRPISPCPRASSSRGCCPAPGRRSC